MQKNRLYRNVGIIQEVVTYGQTLLETGEMEALDSLLQDVSQLSAAVERMLKQEDGHLISLAIRCCRNLCGSILEFHSHSQLRSRIFSLEIVNLVWNLDLILHRQYDFLNYPEKWTDYRRDILERSQAAHKVVGEKNYRYKVTIFLMAYNKLEYTKAAIESIYRYTDFSQDNIELITINNGSTDGTREYFESLPNEKKINYRENVLGVYNCPAIYEGQYRVDFSNDIVATPNWLDNLLACIESDEKIASVVPVCGDYSISCQQGIPVSYENSFAGMADMEKFAAEYNHSNPRLWEERALLMPFLACWRREVLDAGITDNSYTQAEFVDDDWSTTLRRTGWRQILSKDTYMHHFGGVTLNEARQAEKNNSLKNMRQVYYDKWGLDAWESRAIYPMMKENLKLVPLSEKADVLWLEPLYGGSFLALKQQFLEADLAMGTSTALIREEQYLPDAKNFFSQIAVTRDYETWLEADNRTYDIISSGKYFNDIIKYEPIRLIRLLYDRLKPGGYLLLPIENRLGINPVTKLLFEKEKFCFGKQDTVYKIMDVQRLFQYLNTSLYPGQCLLNGYTIMGDEAKTQQLLAGLIASGIQADWQKIHDTLIANFFWLGIKKPGGR